MHLCLVFVELTQAIKDKRWQSSSYTPSSSPDEQRLQSSVWFPVRSCGNYCVLVFQPLLKR